MSLKEVSVKDAQATLQKTITWTKKSEKGRLEWNKACIDSGVRPRKLKKLVKTCFASKVTMFEETLQFKGTIVTCYSQQTN